MFGFGKRNRPIAIHVHVPDFNNTQPETIQKMQEMRECKRCLRVVPATDMFHSHDLSQPWQGITMGFICIKCCEEVGQVAADKAIDAENDKFKPKNYTQPEVTIQDLPKDGKIGRK